MLQVSRAEKLFSGKTWIGDDALTIEEIVHDPLIPELRELLGSTNLLSTLGSMMRSSIEESQVVLEDAKIVYCRHSPRSSCLILFSICVLKTVDGSRENHLLSLKLMSQDEMRSQLRRARKNQFGNVFSPKSIAVDYEKRFFAFIFPIDSKLRKLPRLFSRSRLQSAIDEIDFNQEWRIASQGKEFRHIDIFSYKPERSCLGAVTLKRTDNQSKKRKVFLRHYRQDKGAAVYQGMMHIWNSGERKSGKISFAQPLLYNPEEKLLVQSAVDGIPLSQLKDSRDFDDHLQNVGQAIGVLHGMEGEVLRSRSVENALARQKLLFDTPATNMMFLKEHGGHVLAELENRIELVSQQRPNIIHGDFSIGQVMVDGANVSLIDFDQICMGDPYDDLATFLSRLKSTFMQIGSVEKIQSARLSFLQGYEATQDHSLNFQALAWHEALGNVKIAVSAALYFRPGWKKRAARSLALAEQSLASV